MASLITAWKVSNRLCSCPMLWNLAVRMRSRKSKNINKKQDNMAWAIPLIENFQKEQADKPQEASKLHLVMRIGKTYGRPYWEKEAIKKLLLDGPKNKFVVHKNTPAVNKLLTEVSHLVKVIPITFPNGLPENESDFEHCYLRDNGEFVIHKRIVPVEEVDEEENVWKIHDKTLQKYTKRKLVQFRVNTEYFPTQYVYKHNQDGKEHRYTGDHDVGSNRHDWY